MVNGCQENIDKSQESGNDINHAKALQKRNDIRFTRENHRKQHINQYRSHHSAKVDQYFFIKQNIVPRYFRILHQLSHHMQQHSATDKVSRECQQQQQTYGYKLVQTIGQALSRS
ncbi:hypothetical protein SDC9_126740 [bioreactor metagenome]|uniref:Uncharacterized protein n=1 Tax=bioreactor metagenome TaxID=1076179 RepID=A0A645CS17_9ZZZZ